MTVHHGDPIMLYAVTIDPLNITCFVSDRPDDNEWEVQGGVELEMSPLYGTWTHDLGPLRQTLCVSTSDPRHFRVFLHSKDITNRDYRPTGRRFGGFFSKAAWERFAKTASGDAEGGRSPRSSEEAEGGADHRAGLRARWEMRAGGAASPDVEELRYWLTMTKMSGAIVAIPEIADYEVRRLILDARANPGIKRLDDLRDALGYYVPITTEPRCGGPPRSRRTTPVISHGMSMLVTGVISSPDGDSHARRTIAHPHHRRPPG